MNRESKTDPALLAAFDGLPAEFSFFREVYERDIRPDLMTREQERVVAAEKARSFTLYGVVGGATLAAIIFILFRSPIGLFLGGLAGFGLHAFGRQELKALSTRAKTTIMDEVSRSFELAYTLSPVQPAVLSRFQNLKLIPHWDRSHFEDMLTGTRAAAPFEFFEARLKQRRTTTDSKGRTRTEYVTVFDGQCLVVHFPKSFHGVTKVFRDAGIFNIFKGLGDREDRVRLEDPKFEKAFEVVSTDQIEARYLLTPDFMERLLDLEQTFQGGKLRCAFSGGELFVCVEGGNLFEPGSMFTPLDNPDRVRELLLDFAAVFRLIDTVVERNRSLDN